MLDLEPEKGIIIPDLNIKEEVNLPNPKSVSSPRYIQQKDEFDYLVSLINSLENGRSAGILLYGPPGTGKTLLAISLAEIFNATYYVIDGSPDLDRRDIEGNWEIIRGETRFNYGPLTQAIKDANDDGISFVIINEINAIRENEQISLNSLLSENHINLISKGFERHELCRDSKLIIIGTMNKGVIGINKLQEAFEDRFVASLEIGYPPKKKEIDITMKISCCNERLAKIVVDAARVIRKQAIEDYSLTKIFSTRLVVNFCIIISSMPLKYLKHNIENLIINRLGNNEEEKKSIAMILDGKLFEKKLKAALLNEEILEEFTEIEIMEKSVLKIVEDLRSVLNKYIKLFGRGSLEKKDGNIMWKPLQWLWNNHKEILRKYFELTEELKLPAEYKKKTGNNYIFRGNISLQYIRWIYQKKSKKLVELMKKIHPVL